MVGGPVLLYCIRIHCRRSWSALYCSSTQAFLKGRPMVHCPSVGRQATMVPPTTERMGSWYHILLVNEEQNSGISPLCPEVAEAAPLVETVYRRVMHQIAHSTDWAGVHHSSSEVRKALPPTLKSGHVLLHKCFIAEEDVLWPQPLLVLTHCLLAEQITVALKTDDYYFCQVSGMRNWVIKTHHWELPSQQSKRPDRDKWLLRRSVKANHETPEHIKRRSSLASPLHLIVQMDRFKIAEMTATLSGYGMMVFSKQTRAEKWMKLCTSHITCNGRMGTIIVIMCCLAVNKSVFSILHDSMISHNTDWMDPNSSRAYTVSFDDLITAGETEKKLVRK